MEDFLYDLFDRVSATSGIEASTALMFAGFKARFDAAISAAEANGASTEQLASIRNEARAFDLAAPMFTQALLANQPGALRELDPRDAAFTQASLPPTPDSAAPENPTPSPDKTPSEAPPLL